MDIRTVWTPDRYAAHRIPGITVTARGTLLFCCEARDTFSDWARIDLLLCRSEDGEHIGDPILLSSGDEEHPTVNNPVLIPARDGRVFFLYCRDYSVDGGDVFLRVSEDDGLTWSAPRDLMASTRPDEHAAFAFGPGHGIETPDGTLLSPVWFVPAGAHPDPRSHHPARVSVFTSKDGGGSWSLGPVLTEQKDCPDPNETAAAVTSAGGVYLNTRLTGAGYRAASRSPDGITFTPLSPARDLPDPTCMGSVTAAEYRGHHVLLFVNCASTEERRNLVCRASLDDGHTWPHALTVEPGDAGYADIAVRDGTVYVLYEQRFGEIVRLARFPIEEIFSTL